LNPGRARRPLLASALFIGALASSGCFKYAPVPLASVPPKEEVRVQVTSEAGARLVKELGTYTTQLEGEVASHGDSVSVTVPIGREYRGQVLETANQVLYLGRSEVIDIRRRELSRTRTALATAGVVTGFVLFVKAIIAIADPNPDPQDPPPPPPPGGGNRVPARLFPLFRISIP